MQHLHDYIIHTDRNVIETTRDKFRTQRELVFVVVWQGINSSSTSQQLDYGWNCFFFLGKWCRVVEQLIYPHSHLVNSRIFTMANEQQDMCWPDEAKTQTLQMYHHSTWSHCVLSPKALKRKFWNLCTHYFPLVNSLQDRFSSNVQAQGWA